MVSRSWSKLGAIAAAVVGACALATLLDVDRPRHSSFPPAAGDDSAAGGASPSRPSSRGLFVRTGFDGVRPVFDDAPYRWAEEHVHPVAVAPRPSDETVFFWHVPKSGGSTAKAYYRCLGKTVEVKSRPGDVYRAGEVGVIPSGTVDVVFSSHPGFAIKHLFDPSHKARAVTLLRHPIDRLVSKFYYLQVADWELTYRPDWKDMDVLDWAKGHNSDNNHMVATLAGKVSGMSVTEADLDVAKATLRQRFMVGLMDEMWESIRRFDTIMGIDDSAVPNRKHQMCAKLYFGKREKKMNSNSHPKVEKGSPAWEFLAEKNKFDVRLYEYARELFDEQRGIIDSYAQ